MESCDSEVSFNSRSDSMCPSPDANPQRPKVPHNIKGSLLYFTVGVIQGVAALSPTLRHTDPPILTKDFHF